MAVTNASGSGTTIHEGWDLRCKHTDPNPAGDYPNGASLFEMDTFKVYFYDADTGKWIRKNGEVRS